MIIECFRAVEIIFFSGGRLFGQRLECLVRRDQLLRPQKTRRIVALCEVSAFLFAHHEVAQLDSLTAICRLRMQHTDVVAVIAVLHFFPFDRDTDFLLRDGLKRIGLGQWNPEPRVAFDLGEFNPVNELEFIGALDDARFIGGLSRQRSDENEH